MSKNYSPHLHLARRYWKEHVRPTDTCIDMTCGNGRDTLYLLELAAQGTIIGFDVQKQAIENTARLLQSDPRVTLYLRPHEEIDLISLPKPPRLIVYNLGYLPGGDKSITTKTASTISSIQKALGLLAPDGALSITCYPGHEEGAKEQSAISALLSALDSKHWLVCHHLWINQPRSPTLSWIHPRIS